QVLRLEERGTGAQLVLVRPVPGHDEVEREAIDLGAAPASASIALSVTAPSERDERAWAVALDGARLHRRFADRALGGHVLPELDVPATDARLVGALAGALEQPVPDPVYTRGMDWDAWPRLHVALLAGAASGAELVALDVGPGAASVPTWHRRPLGAAPAAARACALDAATRLVFVASSAEEDRVRIDAVRWDTAGLGAPILVLETRGALLDMEAVVHPDGLEARVFALVALSEPAGALAIESARIDAKGAVARLATRLLLREQLPDDVEQPRLRVVWQDEVFLLARTAAGDPILVLPGSRTPWSIPAPRHSWWDIEVAAGQVHALHVDERAGLAVDLLEAPDDTGP
ncbi:MAG: hypothetical protein ACAI25_09930, partial [Planctomycetota bacterium]